MCNGYCFSKWIFLLFRAPIELFISVSLMVNREELQTLVYKICSVININDKDATTIVYMIRDHYKQKTNKLLKGG